MLLGPEARTTPRIDKKAVLGPNRHIPRRKGLNPHVYKDARSVAHARRPSSKVGSVAVRLTVIPRHAAPCYFEPPAPPSWDAPTATDKASRPFTSANVSIAGWHQLTPQN